MNLTKSQLDQLKAEGYTTVEDVYDPEIDFKALKRDYSEILDGLAGELLAQGKITAHDRDASFSDRVIDVVRQSGGLDLQRFDISLPQKGITAATPMYLGKAGFELLRQPRLADLIEQILGPEIYSNPVQHIRLKVPESVVPDENRPSIARYTPWHQDNGVVTPDADETEMLTVWVAVTDATVEHGCLAIVPGSHWGKLAGHCPRPGGLTIPDGLIPAERVLPVPLRAGSVLFMNRYTMHMSLPNKSNEIRWSFDLRYQPTGRPTGRAVFPGFVVRSRRDPSSALKDHAGWVSLWERARAELAEKEDPAYNRWHADAPWCA